MDLFIPEFVKVAQRLGLAEKKDQAALPKPQRGDPGMLDIRRRMTSSQTVTTVLPGQRVVGKLKQREEPEPMALPPMPSIVISEPEMLAAIAEAQVSGRTRVTVQEFERLLALPYVVNYSKKGGGK